MLIFLWSAFGVFSQLAFVRLFSTTAGETAYYGNIFFIVAIFALSCGFFARRLAPYYYFLPAILLVNYFAILWLGNHYLLQRLPEEFQWGSFDSLAITAADFDLQLAVLILCTTLAPAMLLIGAKQGEHMVRGNYRLSGYLLMAAGGILGALVFTLQNQYFPSQWILFVVWSAAFLVILQLERGYVAEVGRVAITLLPIIVALVFSWLYSGHYLWSAYQKISVAQNQTRSILVLSANDAFISNIELQTAAALHKQPAHELHTVFFDSVTAHDRVLILGSGGGTNDVREALYKHAQHVTAVEIDPQFVRLGTKFDPEHSYLRPEVTTYVTDARRFLNTCQDKFDFIYMPFLDSHTNASNQSRFRLDSFLYTKEGLRLAYSRLNDHGVLFLNFGTPTAWMRQRMFNLLQEATGGEVHAFVLPNTVHTTYAVGLHRAIAPFPKPYLDAAPAFNQLPRELVPTDDWPFLYSQFSALPKEHVRLLYMIAILMVAIFFIARAVADPASGGSAPAPLTLTSYAFFSGAAFFFIQIRTISALTPWFGATYISQAMVVMGIIFSSLAGALLAAARKPLPLSVAWVLLFGCVALGFFADGWFHPLHGSLLPSVALFQIVLLLPTFLAGYIYTCYLEGLSSSAVLQLQLWNLIGGALGALTEGAVIYTGFHASLWIVAAFYALAFLAASLKASEFRLSMKPALEAEPSHAG